MGIVGGIILPATLSSLPLYILPSQKIRVGNLSTRSWDVFFSLSENPQLEKRAALVGNGVAAFGPIVLKEWSLGVGPSNLGLTTLAANSDEPPCCGTAVLPASLWF